MLILLLHDLSETEKRSVEWKHFQATDLHNSSKHVKLFPRVQCSFNTGANDLLSFADIVTHR